MIVDANVYYWTESGMRASPVPGGSHERYVTVTEAERLLADAHRMGRESRQEEVDDLNRRLRDLRK